MKKWRIERRPARHDPSQLDMHDRLNKASRMSQSRETPRNGYLSSRHCQRWPDPSSLFNLRRSRTNRRKIKRVPETASAHATDSQRPVRDFPHRTSSFRTTDHAVPKAAAFPVFYSFTLHRETTKTAPLGLSHDPRAYELHACIKRAKPGFDNTDVYAKENWWSTLSTG